MTLGERIKEQRKRCGLSQEKLAELAGVSRQAVTKWEMDQSAPSTKNLFNLAEIFGTTVDLLVGAETSNKETHEEQIHSISEIEKLKKAEDRRTKIRKNIVVTLVIAAAYLVINLIGRLIGGYGQDFSVISLLFGTDVNQFSYLFGWLIRTNLFWVAMVISVVTALLGKHHFSITTTFGFVVGLLIGEVFGENPAEQTYGQDHFGWAIWILIFLFTIIMGIILEKLKRKDNLFNSKQFRVWCIATIIGIIVITVLSVVGMPQPTGN